LKTEEITLVLRSLDEGSFQVKPKIAYVDEAGQQRLFEPEPAAIEISEFFPSRISTGYEDLDKLLIGGIPETYPVILTSPSCDERDLLIKRFLKAGVDKEGAIAFYVSSEISGMETLAEEFQSKIYFFVCNPRADTIIKDLPNVTKLRMGAMNLTDINIALARAFRELDESSSDSRRICIAIVSDVLLQHQAVQTRRWLTELITDLRTRGFTTLAVMNPLMHPPRDVQAILGLFEGEIDLYDRKTKKGSQKFLKIKRLYNQKYLESELPLKKEGSSGAMWRARAEKQE
jgi:KaiC/GvpD/RAD55 family RecA-like ATPase